MNRKFYYEREAEKREVPSGRFPSDVFRAMSPEILLAQRTVS